jgi:shikimate dehydrogenase
MDPMDQYAVIGNPVAHSKSPQIHAAFARATGQDMSYVRLLAPIGGFAEVVAQFAREGGRGLNVTVPFKLDAFSVAREASDRAQASGACNTLMREGERWYADNTDGAGIVRDLTANLDVPLADRDVLVLGAGGAARGILVPLFGQRPRSVTIANRTMARAHALVERFAHRGPLVAVAPAALAGRQFDVVINATSAGLAGDVALPWPPHLFRGDAFAYDMIYADAPTAFLRWAREHGAARSADGLGMLVEQAAESFLLWRGVRPDTRAVFSLLRPGA